MYVHIKLQRTMCGLQAKLCDLAYKLLPPQLCTGASRLRDHGLPRLTEVRPYALTLACLTCSGHKVKHRPGLALTAVSSSTSQMDETSRLVIPTAACALAERLHRGCLLHHDASDQHFLNIRRMCQLFYQQPINVRYGGPARAGATLSERWAVHALSSTLTGAAHWRRR
jgi:hypothetical protein